MTKNIVVLGGGSYERPFQGRGKVTPYGWDAPLDGIDLVVFTGGADVSPHLYGEPPHPLTHSDPFRDAKEVKVYAKCRELSIPMVGICRGSQFLCVMNEGKLHQHVTGHAIAGTHPMSTENGEVIQVTSTHHQMMIPKGDYKLIGYGGLDDNRLDPEVVVWPKTKCLGVQYHPEYMDKTSRGYEYFQELLEEYVNV